MKKTLLGIATILALQGCNKKSDDISQLQTISSPTITFTGGQYFSINTGGSLPTVTATSYDSVIGESYPVTIVGTDALDNTTPGLYVISAEAKNKYGFVASQNVYVAVTNVDPAIDLSGTYIRAATGGEAHVEELANGLYATDNVGGVVAAANPTLIFPVLFVHTNDTTIQIAAQSTPAGTLESADEFLNLSPGDTSFGYRLSQGGSAFGTTALRIFEKQ